MAGVAASEREVKGLVDHPPIRIREPRNRHVVRRLAEPEGVGRIEEAAPKCRRSEGDRAAWFEDEVRARAQ